MGTFKPRVVKERGKLKMGFSPAISQKSRSRIAAELKAMDFHRWVHFPISKIAELLRLKTIGWIRYYGKFRMSEMRKVFLMLHVRPVKWIRNKYRRFRQQQGRKRSMELTQQEFIRRFSQHILPKAFVRIRHYGFLSSTAKGKRLPELRRNLQVSAPAPAAAITLHRRCPCCKKGKLITLENFDGRGPPTWVLGGAKKIFSCSVN